jgi:selenide,water dikinase
MSDVYAMGGDPVTALNIIGFPVKKLPLSAMKEILKGALEIINEAGAVLVGGHTIEDQEVKFGLAVSGKIHPDRVITNTGMRPGDELVLTKPIGTGIVATALKGGMASDEDVVEIVASMTTLNKAASEAMRKVGVSACTDVTGFGLIGHALEMLGEATVGLVIEAEKVPLFSGTLDHASNGMVPGGTGANKKYCEVRVKVDGSVDPILYDTLFDAQTSGGLLIAVPAEKLPALLDALEKKGVGTAEVIGRCVDEAGFIKVV